MHTTILYSYSVVFVGYLILRQTVGPYSVVVFLIIISPFEPLCYDQLSWFPNPFYFWKLLSYHTPNIMKPSLYTISCVRRTTYVTLSVTRSTVTAERGIQKPDCNYTFMGKRGLVTVVSRPCNHHSNIIHHTASAPHRSFRSSSIRQERKKGWYTWCVCFHSLL